jgi:hypothetical protein
LIVAWALHAEAYATAVNVIDPTEPSQTNNAVIIQTVISTGGRNLSAVGNRRPCRQKDLSLCFEMTDLMRSMR